MQKTPPILISERFPALLDNLLNLLTNLTEDEWYRPTAASGWSVKDLVQHLLAVDIGKISGRRDGYSEAHVDLDSWDDLVVWINRRNEDWVEVTRRISPELLVELLRFTSERVNILFQSLDPFATGMAVSWAGPEPAPVWLDIAREFTERWHHQQHIRDAVDKPGSREPYFLAPVLSTFMFALPQTYWMVHAPGGTAITMTIEGPSGGEWSLVRCQQKWELYTGRPAKTEAEIILPEDDAWRLFTKGISAKQARGRARLLGDPILAAKALEMIAIIA